MEVENLFSIKNNYKYAYDSYYVILILQIKKPVFQI